MGQIEDLVECWIESNKLPFGYEGVESKVKRQICERGFISKYE